jgi:hypothetical protein
MSKLHGLARVMKRAQNENAPGTPVIEVCTPASGSMAPGMGVGAASTSSMVGCHFYCCFCYLHHRLALWCFSPFLSLVLSATHMRLSS